jgi:hypothetical protein
MKEITLLTGEVAYVDDEDYELVQQYRWGRKKMHGSWYARSTTNPRVWMHRLVTGSHPSDGDDVDHIDHNTLNNCRSNLVVTSRSNNQHNRLGARIDSGTGVRGVTYLPHLYKLSPYRAYADLEGKRYYFGHHPTLEQAEAAVKEGRRKLVAYPHAT